MRDAVLCVLLLLDEELLLELLDFRLVVRHRGLELRHEGKEVFLRFPHRPQKSLEFCTRD